MNRIKRALLEKQPTPAKLARAKYSQMLATHGSRMPEVQDYQSQLKDFYEACKQEQSGVPVLQVEELFGGRSRREKEFVAKLKEFDKKHGDQRKRVLQLRTRWDDGLGNLTEYQKKLMKEVSTKSLLNKRKSKRTLIRHASVIERTTGADASKFPS